MSGTACEIPLEFIMYCDWHIGPLLTWCSPMLVFIGLITCLVTSTAFEEEYNYDSGPTYIIPQPNNFTYSVGETAKLLCSIENLGKKYVVWRKQSDPNPISVGDFIYAPDDRYNVSISQMRREYHLLIRNVQRYDEGVYYCEVSSVDKIIRAVLLKVLGKGPKYPPLYKEDDTSDGTEKLSNMNPDIQLTGDKFVTKGQTIRLVCNVTGSMDVPQDLDWFKDGNVIRQYQSDRIHIDKDTSINKRKINSVLEIRQSRLDDTGTYVCRNSQFLIQSLAVVVLNEERTAIDKRGTAAEAKSGQKCNKQWWIIFLTTFCTRLTVQSLLYLR